MKPSTQAQARYHPTIPCLACGKTRRVQCRGRCSACYMKLRESEEPGYRGERKAVQKAWVKSEVKYIDPLRACQILAASFEAHGVDIDQVCEYISMCRARNKRADNSPDKLHRSWGRAWKRRATECRQSSQ